MPLFAGIDLGTTFTAAAITRGGKPEMVTLGSRSTAIPSAILVREDGTILTGEVARRRGLEDPARLAEQFKRRVGDPAPLHLGGSPVGAHILLGKLLRWVVDHIEDREGERLHTVAVTHPANWGAYKQEYLSQAIGWAEIERTVTLTEPEAAAIHYSSTERVEPGSLVAVYDLGGGTFDAAVLRKTEEAFEIVGQPQGVEQLGGIDFDETLFQHILAHLGEGVQDLDPSDPAVTHGLHALRASVTEAKIDLSTDTQTSVQVALPGLHTSVRITRTEFESAIGLAINDTVAALQRALRAAGVEAEELSRVLLVGGSSRIPLVAQTVTEALDRPVAIDADPKHAIALGAAIRAAGGVEATGGPPAGAEAPPADDDRPGHETDEAPPPRDRTDRAPGVAGPGRSVSPRALLAGAAAVAAAVVLLVVLMSGGGGGTTTTAIAQSTVTTAPATTTAPSTTGAAGTTEAPGTTTPGSTVESGTGIILADVTEPLTAIPEQESCAGMCATIDSVTTDGPSLVIEWTEAGFTPDVTAFHAHFYWGDQPAAASGNNAGDFGEAVGDWELTDDQPFTSGGLLRAPNRPPGVDTLCVTVADSNHNVVDPSIEDCARVPDPVTEWSISTVAGDVSATSAGFDGEGRPVIAWLDGNAGVNVTTCDEATCSAPRTFPAAAGDVHDLSISAGGATPVVAVAGPNGLGLLVCEDAECSAASTTIVDPETTVDADVTRTDTGDLAIVYQTLSGTLRVATCSEPCAEPTLVEVLSGTDLGPDIFDEFVAIEIIDGLPVLAYSDSGLGIARCLDVRCTSVNAHVVDASDSDLDLASKPSLAVTPDGTLVVAYSGEGNTPAMLACVDAPCTLFDSGTPIQGVAFHMEVAIGSAGYPIVAANPLRASSGDVTVSASISFCGDAACSAATAVDLAIGTFDAAPAPTNWVGQGISIAIGDDGPLVAFRGVDGELVVARPSGL